MGVYVLVVERSLGIPSDLLIGPVACLGDGLHLAQYHRVRHHERHGRFVAIVSPYRVHFYVLGDLDLRPELEVSKIFGPDKLNGAAVTLGDVLQGNLSLAAVVSADDEGARLEFSFAYNFVVDEKSVPLFVNPGIAELEERILKVRPHDRVGDP